MLLHSYIFFPVSNTYIVSTYQTVCLYVCLLICLYALNYCIYVYIEGLMED